MKGTVIEYECEICGQHGNSPHWHKGRALCKFHSDTLKDKDKTREQRRLHKEFKKQMARFEKRR